MYKGRESREKLSQSQTNSNVTRFLDGFEVDDSKNSSEGESEYEDEINGDAEGCVSTEIEITENTETPTMKKISRNL